MSEGRVLRVLIVGSSHVGGVVRDMLLALRRMGHAAENVDPELGGVVSRALHRSPSGMRFARRVLTAVHGDTLPLGRRALRDAGRFGPDLILVPPIKLLTPDAVHDLKAETGARVVGWFQDHVVNFGRHQFLLADYDALFFKDRYIVDRLTTHAGLMHVHYLPEAVNAETHHPVELTADDRRRFGCDVAVYGNLYPYRVLLLRHLTEFDFKLYGNRPSRWIRDPLVDRWQGHAVVGEDKCRAVRAAKVVVNNSHFGEVHSANARLFEVAGIGGFQITDAPGVEEFFEPGTEVAVFRGPREMCELVRHYLRHDDERAAMARRAHERALREHTLAHRFRQMFTLLGLNGGNGARELR